jgi:hypothetical protein
MGHPYVAPVVDALVEETNEAIPEDGRGGRFDRSRL